jgi:hypothetical protein
VLGNDSVGDPIFADVGYYAGVAETDWSWNPSIADFDNDGNKDIFITNGYPRDVTDHDFVAFRNRSLNIASKEQLIEQMPQIKISNYAFRNNDSLQFSNVTADWGLDEEPSAPVALSMASSLVSLALASITRTSPCEALVVALEVSLASLVATLGVVATAEVETSGVSLVLSVVLVVDSDGMSYIPLGIFTLITGGVLAVWLACAGQELGGTGAVQGAQMGAPAASTQLTSAAARMVRLAASFMLEDSFFAPARRLVEAARNLSLMAFLRDILVLGEPVSAEGWVVVAMLLATVALAEDGWRFVRRILT